MKKQMTRVMRNYLLRISDKYYIFAAVEFCKYLKIVESRIKQYINPLFTFIDVMPCTV